MKNIQTAWIWQDELSTATVGVTLDVERKLLQWYEAIGCACAGSNSQQTIENFLEKGSPFFEMPNDIEEELRSQLQQMYFDETDSKPM